jgi:hypothetical protein
MPRELISREVEFDADREYHGPDPVAVGAWLEKRVRDLSVRWGRDWDIPAHVPAYDVASVQLTVREEVYGPPTEEYPGGEPQVGQERYSSALTRKQINLLIKTLRKARDQVFGVDE